MPVIIKIDAEHPEPDRIDEAVSLLKSGGVIAFPTETSYGLGADARDEAAIDKIFGIKGRDFRNPFSSLSETAGTWKPLRKSFPKRPKAHGPLLARAAERSSSRGVSVSPKLMCGCVNWLPSPVIPIAMAISRRLGGPQPRHEAQIFELLECSSAGEEALRLEGKLDEIVRWR